MVTVFSGQWTYWTGLTQRLAGGSGIRGIPTGCLGVEEEHSGEGRFRLAGAEGVQGFWREMNLERATGAVLVTSAASWVMSGSDVTSLLVIRSPSLMGEKE